MSATPAAAQTCSFTATNMAFGSVQLSSGTAIDVTATLTANCSRTNLLSPTVYICPNFGDGSGGSSGSDRTMLAGSNSLRYQLYSDSTRSTVWGSPGWQGAPPVLSYTLPLPLLTYSQNFTIYGRIMPSQQGVTAGSYTSSMTGGHLYTRVGTASTVCSTGAGTVTSFPGFTISATVLASCTVTTTDVDFGSKGFLTTITDAQGSVGVRCSNGKAWTASLMLGSGETASARTMTNGSTNITYALYKDSARSTTWSSGSTAQTVGNTGTGLLQTIPVYGRVPIQTTPATGTYTDTVIVNIDY